MCSKEVECDKEKQCAFFAYSKFVPVTTRKIPNYSVVKESLTTDKDGICSILEHVRKEKTNYSKRAYMQNLHIWSRNP